MPRKLKTLLLVLVAAGSFAAGLAANAAPPNCWTVECPNGKSIRCCQGQACPQCPI